MRHETSLALLAYWQRQRGGRAVPLRADINPADIRSILPAIFILERRAEGGFAFRLAGTGICALFGRELKAAPLAALWQGESIDRATSLAAAVAETGRPAVLDAGGESRGGRQVTTEVALMPLASRAGRTDRVIGALAALERPFWLSLDPLVSLTLTGGRLLDAEDVATATEGRRARQEGDRRHAVTVVARSAGWNGPGHRTLPHLVVVEGGRED